MMDNSHDYGVEFNPPRLILIIKATIVASGVIFTLVRSLVRRDDTTREAFVTST